MPLKDLFFPENKDIRKRTLELAERLQVYLELSFNALGTLVEVLNNSLGLCIKPIKVDLAKTVKDILDVFVNKAQEVEREINSLGDTQGDLVDSQMYQRLSDLLAEKNIQLVRGLSDIIIGNGVAILPRFVTSAVRLVKQKSLFSKLAVNVGTVKICAVASLSLAVLVAGGYATFSYFAGRTEKRQLQRIIAELEEVLRHIEPATKELMKKVANIEMDLNRDHFVEHQLQT